MNWHTPSLTTSFQFWPACNSRPWNEAIGMQLEEEEGRLLKYIPVHFSPDQRDFFFYRDPWVPPDTSTAFCIVFTRIIWYIGLFLSPSLSLSLSLSFIRVWWHALWSTSKSPRVNFNAVSAVTWSTENRRWTDQIYYFRGKSGTGGCFKAGSESRLWLFARRLFLPLYETVIRLFSRVRLKFETYLCMYIYINLKLFEIHRWLDGYYYYLYNVWIGFKMGHHENVGTNWRSSLK